MEVGLGVGWLVAFGVGLGVAVGGCVASGAILKIT